ncbi:MAG: bis(5'-nucleosyl)-tetraphosphatase (symmetrical) YqeK [Lachnospiraceae bacterium]
MNEQLTKIVKQLQLEQEPERYTHTIGVMYTAASLAMRYSYDLNRAMLAGALHDCAKCTSHSNMLLLCQQRNIPISETEEKSPFLLHAKLGVLFSKEKYGIYDEEILHAILVHTTGCPHMSLLDKILYVADYIEPNRIQAHNLEQIRTLAFEDLDLTMRQILNDTLAYLREKNFIIDPITQQTQEFYIKEEFK